MFIDGEEVKPAIVKQRPYILVTRQYICDGLFRGFDTNRQTKRIMNIAFAVMYRLPWKTCPQQAAIAFHDPDPSGDIVQELVASAKNFGRDCRTVVLKADPACHHDRRRQDQLENAEALVLRPIIVMQEHTPGEILACCTMTWRGNKGLTSGKAPLGAHL